MAASALAELLSFYAQYPGVVFATPHAEPVAAKVTKGDSPRALAHTDARIRALMHAYEHARMHTSTDAHRPFLTCRREFAERCRVSRALSRSRGLRAVDQEPP